MKRSGLAALLRRVIGGGAVVLAAAAVLAPAATPALAALPQQMSLAAVQGGGAAQGAAFSLVSVGAGQCVVISCPDGAKIIDDCGTLDGVNNQASAQAFVQSVIRANDPLYIVVSHADIDHYNLIRSVVGVHPVERVIVGQQLSNYTNGQFDAWVAALHTQAGTVTPVEQNLPATTHDLPGVPHAGMACAGAAPGDGLYLLSVNAGFSNNDKSAVTLFKDGQVKAMALGDAAVFATSTALSNYVGTAAGLALLKSTLVVGAHHGASTGGSNPPTLVKATVPSVVAFSASGRFGHPRCVSADQFNYPAHANLARAFRHQFTCYTSGSAAGRNDPRRGDYMDAQFNTADTGALILFTDGESWSIWTCPGNQIGAQCSLSAPR